MALNRPKHTQWPVRLFSKSVLKQAKYRRMVAALGPVEGLHLLDIGSDNGVFSYLLRQQGGHWKSADLDARSVAAIRQLVHSDVYRIADGQPLPFVDDEFDCVVIVDIIEHLHDDRGFMREVYRVLKPGGKLIINAPTVKTGSALMRFRDLVGQTEDIHGHVRPGYTHAQLLALLNDQFRLIQYETHTKFFSKFMDTLMVLGISLLKRNRREARSGRGVLVTGEDMQSHQRLFILYSLVYPFVWLFSRLDRLLPFRTGYMLFAAGFSTKPATDAARVAQQRTDGTA